MADTCIMKLSLALIAACLTFCQSAPTASIPPTPSYTHIPPAQAGPQVNNATGYLLRDLGDGAYFITDGIYNNLFFVACESVVVVDAPPTTGHKVLRAIRTITPLPISHVVYSHSHADHIGAAYLLGSPANITFIAHKDTAIKLAATADYKHRPYPTLTFESSYTLQVCNQTLQLDYNGPNHEPGNIFIYAPRQKILMLVDVIYPGWTPFDKLGEVEDVPGFIKAHDQILTYDFKHFVGGHVNRPGTRHEVITQREYVQDLFAACTNAINASAMPANGSNELSIEVLNPPIEMLNSENPWASTAWYSGILSEWAYIETGRKWRDRLAAYDVFGLSNAQVLLEHVRLDWGILGPFGVMG